MFPIAILEEGEKKERKWLRCEKRREKEQITNIVYESQ
jgi:hypothetical protein